MNRENYKRLGEYIRQVDVRNRDLTVTNLLGVSVDKTMFPSIANTIGTDFGNYKVIFPGQFVYISDTSRRGDKIAISLMTGSDVAIVSSAYTVFEVIDETVLAPSYLMMWFRRPEFDRYARFMSNGSAREIFSWDEMCEVYLPIPDIDEQCRIVAEYQAVEKRIATNEALIAKLEETATTIYKDMFVEGINTENLPDGWHEGIFGEIAEVSSGKTLSDKRDSVDNVYKYPVAGASGIIGFTCEYNQSTPYLTTGRVGTIGVVNKYQEKSWTADNVLVIKSDYYDFAYQFLKGFRYEDIIKGGVQNLITQTDIKNAYCIVPERDRLIEFERKANILSEDIRLHQQENTLLLELKSTLLGKMVI